MATKMRLRRAGVDGDGIASDVMVLVVAVVGGSAGDSIAAGVPDREMPNILD